MSREDLQAEVGSEMDRPERMLWTRWNWHKLFNYGEVICFASAWAVALLMALTAERPPENRGETRTFAISTDMSGMQARASR